MILITGASGLIGTALANAFLKQQIPLRLQIRSRHKLAAAIQQEGNVEIMALDFHSASDLDLEKLLKGVDCVIHAAGLVHQPDAGYQEYEFLNVRLTEQLAKLAVKNGVQTFVFFSTSAIYGPGPFENISESGPFNAQTPYAVSKLYCEKFLKDFPGIPRTIVVRPALVFGEGDRGNLLSLIRQIKKGIYFNIGGDPAFKSIIYTADVAHAVKLCLEHVDKGYHEYNLANPDVVSVASLSRQIADCLNGSKSIPTLPRSVVKLGAQISQTILKEKSPLTTSQVDKLTSTTTCSVEKLQKATNFYPQYPLAQALNNEIAWARDNQLL